ncbi:MAG: T9SS type A sorting domain-containing protein [Candidatus Kapaibacterium sp.]
MKEKTKYGGIILLPLLWAAMALSATAGTQVSGLISGQVSWGVSASPYIINGTVTINESASLTINEGVSVLMNDGAELIVKGSLNASGTASKPVSFDSFTNKNEGWKQIRFISGSSGSLKHVNIRRGGSGGFPTLRAAPGSIPVMSNVSLKENYLNAVALAPGIYEGNISIMNYGLPYFIDGKITAGSYSDLSIGAGCEFYMAQGSILEVKGNLDIDGKHNDPVRFALNPGSQSGYWGGIIIIAPDKNVIFRNTEFKGGGNSPETSVAIVNIRNGSAAFEGCSFSSAFKYGIFISENAYAELGGSSRTQGNNYFFGFTNKKHALVNNSANDILASNNCWGADNIAGNKAVIFDKDDKSTTGRVSITPFKTNCLPIVPGRPEITLPEDGSKDITIDARIEWTEAEYALMYTLQAAADSSFNDILTESNDIKSTSVNIDLPAMSRIYARVKAVNFYYESPWSETVSFETADTSAPGKPEFITLNSDTIFCGGKIEWNNQANTTSFDIQISDKVDFGKIIYAESTEEYGLVPEMLAEGHYFIRVRAENQYGKSAWSEQIMITIPDKISRGNETALPGIIKSKSYILDDNEIHNFILNEQNGGLYLRDVSNNSIMINLSDKVKAIDFAISENQGLTCVNLLFAHGDTGYMLAFKEKKGNFELADSLALDFIPKKIMLKQGNLNGLPDVVITGHDLNGCRIELHEYDSGYINTFSYKKDLEILECVYDHTYSRGALLTALKDRSGMLFLYRVRLFEDNSRLYGLQTNIIDPVEVHFADYNGDGALDFMAEEELQSQLKAHVFINSGGNFLPSAQSYYFPKGSRLFMLDFAAGSADDIIVQHPNGKIEFMANNGGEFNSISAAGNYHSIENILPAGPGSKPGLIMQSQSRLYAMNINDCKKDDSYKLPGIFYAFEGKSLRIFTDPGDVFSAYSLTNKQTKDKIFTCYPVEFQQKNGNSLLLKELPSGRYTLAADIYDRKGRYKGSIQRNIITPDLYAEPPHEWNYESLTGSNSILILRNDAAEEAGKEDAVGVFYAAENSLKCGGFNFIESGNSAITAWGDNNQTPDAKDGFYNDEIFRFMIWNASEEKQLPVKPVYEKGRSSFKPDTISFIKGFTSLDKHEIELHGGRIQFVSSRVMPFYPYKDSIIGKQPIEAGFSVWDHLKGYEVYSRDSGALFIEGYALNNNYSIPIEGGKWVMLPYLRTDSSSPGSYFASVSDDLVAVTDNEGNLYMPSKRINTIGALQPGRAYIVFLKDADTLKPLHPVNPDDIEETSGAVSEGSGFSQILLLNIDDELTGGIITVNDESGAEILSTRINDSKMLLSLFADNPYTNEIDGLKEGELLNLSITDNYGVEKQFFIGSISDPLNYGQAASLQFKEKSILELGISASPVSVEHDKNFLTVVIKDCHHALICGLSTALTNNLELHDITGRVIIKEIIKEKSQHLIDISRLSGGIYYLKIKNRNFIKTEKILITK